MALKKANATTGSMIITRESKNRLERNKHRPQEERRLKTGCLIIALSCVLLLRPSVMDGQPRVVAQLMEDLVVTEIKKDVFLVNHSFPWPANSLLVRLNKTDFVWADTPYTPGATSLVIRWLYMKYGERIRITEINTGFHIDNLGGNRELLKWKIPIYGSTLTCNLLKTKSQATMRKTLEWLRDPKDEKYFDAYRSFVFYEPTKRFDINKTQTLRFGKETVEIFYPGPTHTYDNVVVYFPSKKVLFGTCMVLAAAAEEPGYVDDGNVSEWPKSLRKVLERYKHAEIIVPGHGDPGDRSLIEHSINVLERFKKNEE